MIETLLPQCELGCNLRTVVTLLDQRLRFHPAGAEQCDACTTPLLLDLNGRRQLIIMGANQLDGYDPATGKQRWCLPGLTGGRTGPSPTAVEGLLYAVRELRGALICVAVGGRGQLSADRIVWQYRQNTPDTCCPIVYRGWLFTVSDERSAQCLDAIAGEDASSSPGR